MKSALMTKRKMVNDMTWILDYGNNHSCANCGCKQKDRKKVWFYDKGTVFSLDECDIWFDEEKQKYRYVLPNGGGGLVNCKFDTLYDALDFGIECMEVDIDNLRERINRFIEIRNGQSQD